MAETAELQRTLFIIKPDAQPARNEVLTDLFTRGFGLAHLTTTSERLGGFIWERHYAEHQGKPFYPELMEFMQSGPVSVAVVEAPLAIHRLRAAVGPTKIADATPSQLRGRYRHLSTGAGPSTLFHASDSYESAKREIELWQMLFGWKIC